MNKNIKETAHSIGVFMNKYHADFRQVEWPDWEFEIKEVYNPQIDEASLKEVSNGLWTFKGTTDVKKLDKTTRVKTTSQCKITGSAEVRFYENVGGPKELLPSVKKVIVTKIEL